MAGDGWDDMDILLEDSARPGESSARQTSTASAEPATAPAGALHEDVEGDGSEDTTSQQQQAPSATSTARRHAAAGKVTAVQGIFARERRLEEWGKVLDAFPETMSTYDLRQLLPVPASRIKVGRWRPRVHVPATAAVMWYIRRSFSIIARTGLCGKALDVLHHGMWAYTDASGEGPSASAKEEELADFVTCQAEELPEVSQEVLSQTPEVCLLYGMFRLCAEYAKYCEVALACGNENLEDGEEVIEFAQFCAFKPQQRVHLVLQSSVPSTIVKDVKEWIASIAIHECFPGGESPAGESALLALPEEDWLFQAAAEACTAPIENPLMEAVVGKAADPNSFLLAAELVQASSPALARGDRIIKDPVCLLEFIMGSVYSDARCRAVDIFGSVDAMFGCIPNADVNCGEVDAEPEKWQVLQRQADELERHLGCVEVLHKHGIKLSLSFSDLRSGCTNEPMAIRALWNLFRVLGARYRQAGFWRNFQKELFYLHDNAFAAVNSSAVYEMFCRCLVEQEHFEVLKEVVADWCAAKAAEGGVAVTQIAESLVELAKELVNSSPALRHDTLERAKKLLKCIGQQNAEFLSMVQAETDFIKACELLHDLVHTHPGHLSRLVGDLKNIDPLAKLSQVTAAVSNHDLKRISPFATLSQVTSAVSASLPVAAHWPAGGGGTPAPPASRTSGDATTTSEATSMKNPFKLSKSSTFSVHGPMQLRLLLHHPLRVVTDLLQYNPSVLMESEQLHTFCRLLGLAPSSPCWAEVMAVSGASNLLCGQREEALNVTEKLLANSHPAAWKLAVALASSEAHSGENGNSIDHLSLDHGYDFVADAAMVCPVEELPELLSFFKCEDVIDADDAEEPVDEDLQESRFPACEVPAADEDENGSLGAALDALEAEEEDPAPLPDQGGKPAPQQEAGLAVTDDAELADFNSDTWGFDKDEDDPLASALDALEREVSEPSALAPAAAEEVSVAAAEAPALAGDGETKDDAWDFDEEHAAFEDGFAAEEASAACDVAQPSAQLEDGAAAPPKQPVSASAVEVDFDDSAWDFDDKEEECSPEAAPQSLDKAPERAPPSPMAVAEDASKEQDDLGAALEMLELEEDDAVAVPAPVAAQEVVSPPVDTHLDDSAWDFDQDDGPGAAAEEVLQSAQEDDGLAAALDALDQEDLFAATEVASEVQAPPEVAAAMPEVVTTASSAAPEQPVSAAVNVDFDDSAWDFTEEETSGTPVTGAAEAQVEVVEEPQLAAASPPHADPEVLEVAESAEDDPQEEELPEMADLSDQAPEVPEASGAPASSSAAGHHHSMQNNGARQPPWKEPDSNWFDQVTSRCRWAEACPEVDLPWPREPILEEVLQSGTGEAASRLIRAAAGQSSLSEAGINPSEIACAAALQEISSAASQVPGGLGSSLAPIMPWLSCEDALDILTATLNSRGMASELQAEVLAHFRATSACSSTFTSTERERLEAALECAEMLRVLRSVCRAAGDGQVLLDANFDARQSLQEAGAGWLRLLAGAEEDGCGGEDLVALAEAVLHGHEAWRQPA